MFAGSLAVTCPRLLPFDFGAVAVLQLSLVSYFGVRLTPAGAECPWVLAQYELFGRQWKREIEVWVYLWDFRI